MRTYVALDLETTGVDSSRDRILEVGAVRLNDRGELLERYQQLVCPGVPLSSFITSLTGISDEDVSHAPDFEEIRDDFVEFIGRSPIIGHNVQFDLGFLRANGVTFDDALIYDTWVLATILLPHLPTHSLEPLVQQLQLPIQTAHRALNDAEATAHLFHYLQQCIQELPLDLVAYLQHILHDQPHPLLGLLPDIPAATSALQLPKRAVENIEITTDEKSTITLSLDALEKHFQDLAQKTTPPFQHFELRESQIEMSSIIARALLRGERHIIEAGTGLGKSFAYLLPALIFAQSQPNPIVISTHTLHLQDQLFQKDIPLLQQFLPFSSRVAVLKGRRHYLCTKRFEEFLHNHPSTSASLSLLVKLLLWYRTTPDGDLTTLRLLPQEQPLLQSLVASMRNCDGTRCIGSIQHQCFYKLARERAAKSHCVIVNHSLLLTDALQDGDALAYSHLIIDEAHHLEDALVSSQQTTITPDTFEELLQQLRSQLSPISTSFPQALHTHLLQLHSELQNQVTLLFGLSSIIFRRIQRQTSFHDATLSIDEQFEALPEWKTFQSATQTLLQKIERFQEEISDGLLKRSASSKSPNSQPQRVDRLLAELSSLSSILVEFSSARLPESVYWFEQRIRPIEELHFHRAPLRIREAFHETIAQHLQSCVLTSATLRTSDSFDYLRGRLGLDEQWEEHVLLSPYDYHSQVQLILPSDIPDPSSAHYLSSLVHLVLASARAFDGRTLVLTTSHRAIREIADALSQQDHNFTVLAQGIHGGKSKLLQQFRQKNRSILIGTQSFWEGIDVVGDALSSVVIAKLPFPVPTDPIIAQQASEYDNPFLEFMVPKAIMKFQQGFGRLIRSATDQGVVIVADRRVQTAAYGTLFLESLPSCAVEVLPVQEVDLFLRSLSSFSPTDSK